MKNNHIGNIVKKYRMARHLDLHGLAWLTGIERSVLQGIEEGRIKSPSFKDLHKIAFMLGFDETKFLYEPFTIPKDENSFGKVGLRFGKK